MENKKLLNIETVYDTSFSSPESGRTSEQSYVGQVPSDDKENQQQEEKPSKILNVLKWVFSPFYVTILYFPYF